VSTLRVRFRPPRRVAIHDDGWAGETEVVAQLPGFLPDGLAFDSVGNIYVGCYRHLGRWHVSAVELHVADLPLRPARETAV
jgi:sugar lactone lactonase YvrE